MGARAALEIPTAQTYTVSSVPTGLFFPKQSVDFIDKLHQPLGVLLVCNEFTQFRPAFFGSALHLEPPKTKRSPHFIFVSKARIVGNQGSSLSPLHIPFWPG